MIPIRRLLPFALLSALAGCAGGAANAGGDGETAFRMTLTGEDATVVQLRFDRLLENFACSTS